MLLKFLGLVMHANTLCSINQSSVICITLSISKRGGKRFPSFKSEVKIETMLQDVCYALLAVRLSKPLTKHVGLVAPEQGTLAAPLLRDGRHFTLHFYAFPIMCPLPRPL